MLTSLEQPQLAAEQRPRISFQYVGTASEILTALRAYCQLLGRA